METKNAMIISDILDKFTYRINQETDEDGMIHRSKITKIKNKLINTLCKDSEANKE